MIVDNIPEIYTQDMQSLPELFMYDFRMTEDVVRSKVQLSMNMFSFLQVGRKQVHCGGTSIAVNKDQSLLLKKGNWLWTELLDTEATYYCKLFFFSEAKLKDFLDRRSTSRDPIRSDRSPYFIISNDAYIDSYLNTLSTISGAPSDFMDTLLSVKFEELMLYLLQKYGAPFEQYLQSMISQEVSRFEQTVESHMHSNLKLEEIAFLCNMSLSTFKRHFIKVYEVSPGKWFKDKRLDRAKALLEQGAHLPSEIYLDFGYNNLSNFSIAFKNKFGLSPSEVMPS